MNWFLEFFGIGGYKRTPEGAWSWQHIVFAFSFVFIAILLGIFLGLKFKNNDKNKNKVLVISAISIDGLEILRIINACIREGNPGKTIINCLPLFLCSILMITLPIAAFSKGRLKEAAIDFTFIFGLVAGVIGAVAASQIFNSAPVISMDCFCNTLNHCISLFSAIFIGITGMAKLKIENLWISIAIVLGVAIIAQIVNIVFDKNYMFLDGDDGTAYSILYNLVGGNLIIYKICVVLIFIIIILVFYLVKLLVSKKKY